MHRATKQSLDPVEYGENGQAVVSFTQRLERLSAGDIERLVPTFKQIDRDRVRAARERAIAVDRSAAIERYVAASNACSGLASRLRASLDEVSTVLMLAAGFAGGALAVRDSISAQDFETLTSFFRLAGLGSIVEG